MTFNIIVSLSYFFVILRIVYLNPVTVDKTFSNGILIQQGNESVFRYNFVKINKYIGIEKLTSYNFEIAVSAGLNDSQLFITFDKFENKGDQLNLPIADNSSDIFPFAVTLNENGGLGEIRLSPDETSDSLELKYHLLYLLALNTSEYGKTECRGRENSSTTTENGNLITRVKLSDCDFQGIYCNKTSPSFAELKTVSKEVPSLLLEINMKNDMLLAGEQITLDQNLKFYKFRSVEDEFDIDSLTETYTEEAFFKYLKLQIKNKYDEVHDHIYNYFEKFFQDIQNLNILDKSLRETDSFVY